MTYLQLVNNVLIRLREDTITEGELDSDPYWRFIGSAVNDAKDRVEDSWQWGVLRGRDAINTDPNLATNQGPRIELPNSADNHYIIKRVTVYPNDTGAEQPQQGRRHALRWVDIPRIRQRYADPGNTQKGSPSDFAVTGATDNGNIRITLWPTPTNNSGVGDYWLEVDRVNHQDSLVAHDDNLLVPSLPVYTLATALASRERGEVGGTPTSELFAIADRHLADAIAQDSALYANELDWWADTDLHNTNVRFA